MARAGFYAVESKSIRRNPDGSYYLQVAEERAPIAVEDTPYVVRSVADDGKGGFILMLNDEEREALDPATLEVAKDNVLYCRVKQGEFRARFLRNAYYHLSSRFSADEGGGAFSILIGDRRYPIRIAPEGDRANGGPTQRA